MLVFRHYKPLCFLQRLFSLCFTLAFFSIATVEISGIDQSGAGSILFTNRTPFTVHLVRGSGRIDAATVAPKSSVKVSNIAGIEETYYPLFDIPLTAAYSLPRLRPENPDFCYQIASNIAQQEIEINIPSSFYDNYSYIIFTSNSKGGGVSLSRNQSSNLMTGINYQEAKSVINERETLVFRENPLELQSLRINPLNITLGEISYQAGYVYTFVFDGNEVTLTDARPLVDVGKSSPLVVIFAGDNLSDLEQRQLITALATGLERSNIPFFPLTPSSIEAPMSYESDYTLKIMLSTHVVPPQPPIYFGLIHGEFQLLLIKNNKLLGFSNTRQFTEMDRSLVIHISSVFLSDLSWCQSLFKL